MQPPSDRPADEGEARFRTLIDANADGVLVVRRDGRIAFANPAACALLGRRAADLVGGAFGVPIVPGATAEVDLPLGDGQVRIAELRVSRAEWEGEPAYLAALRDVTDRKRLEEQLRRQAEQLAEADRRKDEFLAMLGHELRNPLATIGNAVHYLRRDGTPADRSDWACDVIGRQAAHLSRLVDDLLEVSRITRGKIQVRREPLDARALIDRAVESVRPLVAARAHELIVAVSPGPLWLEADPTRLEQILVNLLANAAKYTEPRGRITLTAGTAADRVTITVADTGVGIAPAMLPHVFDLFTQGDHSLDRARGGLGIGLALVRKLVELHGGHVTAASAGPGHGSTFTVQLPAAAPPADLPGPAPPRPTSARPGLRVLIVDDNEDAARLTALLLEAEGYHARTVHDGPSALEAARAFRPEVVLLDIGLPGLDGYQVASALRREESGRDLLLIAVSGYGEEQARRRSRAAGCDHHLVKPVDPGDLLNLIAARCP